MIQYRDVDQNKPSKIEFRNDCEPATDGNSRKSLPRGIYDLISADIRRYLIWGVRLLEAIRTSLLNKLTRDAL